jgi:hypothetical protein
VAASAPRAAAYVRVPGNPVVVKTVQHMLGNATVTMTLDNYGHLYPDELDQMTRHIGCRGRVPGAYRRVTKSWLTSGFVGGLDSFDSPSPPLFVSPGAVSSAGERFPDTEEVAGSIPVPRTSDLMLLRT